jgi:hypothetical protein
MAQLLTLHTPKWWWRSFIFGIVIMVLFGRVFPESITWPDVMPGGIRAILLLFMGIVIGAAIQAGWWIVLRARLRAQ